MTARRRFGSVRKLPSGRYQVRYRDQSGREQRAPETFPTKTDASRYLALVESDLHRGDWIDPAYGRQPFSFWADEWKATTSHLRPKTVARYYSALHTHILPVFGPMPMATINQLDVKRFMADMLAVGAAPASVATARKVLRLVLGAAQGAGAIKANPCDGAKIAAPTRRDMHFLNADQVRELVNEVGEQYRALVYFAAYTGMRAGEIEALRIGRLNLLKRTADVVESLAQVEGFGLVFGPTKTYQRRTVRLPASCAECSLPISTGATRARMPWSSRARPAARSAITTSIAGTSSLRCAGWRREASIRAVRRSPKASDSTTSGTRAPRS